MITLATDRLILRGWRDDDLDDLAAMNADPEVMRYILDGSVRDRAQTVAALAKMRGDWDRRGFGRAWQRIAIAAPRIAKYQSKSDREYPVIRLTPR